jgi:hypothetical protein
MSAAYARISINATCNSAMSPCKKKKNDVS